MFLFFFNLGCNGFKQSSDSSLGTPANGSAPTDDFFSSPNVDYQLSIQTGPFEGRLVVDQIRNSSIKILVPIGLNNFVPVGDFLAPAGSTLSQVVGRVIEDNMRLKTLELYVPLVQLSHSVNVPKTRTLPNGEPFPKRGTLGFPSEEAYHGFFPLDAAGKTSLHVYFSPPNLMGVFLQTPFDLTSASNNYVAPLGSLIPVGFFSTHPHRSSLNGGAFLFISLPR